MNPDAVIQNLGIKIANDAITIASLEAQLGELRAEAALRVAEANPESDED